VLGFRKDEYLNHSKMIKSSSYFFLCSNQVIYFATEARAHASLKIARHVHRLLGHHVVSSNWVLKYSNKATSFIPNLLFLLKNITHTASYSFSSSTSISSRFSTIIPRLCFCPAPPIVIVIVVVDIVIVIVVVVCGAIAVAVALALTIDFNYTTIAIINMNRNWGAVIILHLLASGWWPSGQLSGRLAPATNPITATANGHIIRASY
jgi:hypothetical protein